MNKLNKEQILNILKKYNFDKNEFIILSGASMVMYGIREYTSDIDIAVSNNLYNNLINNYKCTLERYDEQNKVNVYFIDNVINFSTNFYNDCKYKIIDNIKCQTIDAIIKMKKSFNREKDLRDIKELEKYL